MDRRTSLHTERYPEPPVWEAVLEVLGRDQQLSAVTVCVGGHILGPALFPGRC